jgi:uncharacterized protein (TIGR02145 family)
MCQKGIVNQETGHCLAESCDDGWSGEDCEKGSFPAYGHNYKTVIINGQEWMAENMQTTVGNDGNSITCHVPSNEDANFTNTYGCFYTWEDAQNVCPVGWHLPTSAEFEALIDYVGGRGIIGLENLKATSWTDGEYGGKDTYGFNVLKAGYIPPSLNYQECCTYFWSSTDNDNRTASALFIGNRVQALPILNQTLDKQTRVSVRCVKN